MMNKKFFFFFNIRSKIISDVFAEMQFGILNANPQKPISCEISNQGLNGNFFPLWLTTERVH